MDGLVSLDSVAGQGGCQQMRKLGLPVRREQCGQGPADRVGRGQAVHLRRAFIPRGDAAVRLYAQDRVVGGPDDRGELGTGLVRGGQLSVRANQAA